MTEIIPDQLKSKSRLKFGHPKRRSLWIDMTPMVDLGFLLITFFVFTSTLNEPKAMKLIMPKENGPGMPTKESGALTILPAGSNNVYYYEGQFEPEKLRHTTYKAIREIIVNKKRRTATEDIFIIIKPAKSSDYKDVVDILDEMVISDIKKYALVKITNQEELLIK